jgi:hypothetical protein
MGRLIGGSFPYRPATCGDINFISAQTHFAKIVNGRWVTNLKTILHLTYRTADNIIIQTNGLTSRLQ